MSGFPAFGGLPQSRLTSPVALKAERPVSYLASVRRNSALLYLCVPDKFYFCSTLGNLFCFAKAFLIYLLILVAHSYGNFFYLPAGHIRWYGGKCHAIACSPSFIFQGKHWEERFQFSKNFGTTQEVFFARGPEVYYAGTYKCHQPPDSLPQTLALLGDLVGIQDFKFLCADYSFL